MGLPTALGLSGPKVPTCNCRKGRKNIAQAIGRNVMKFTYLSKRRKVDPAQIRDESQNIKIFVLATFGHGSGFELDNLVKEIVVNAMTGIR